MQDQLFLFLHLPKCAGTSLLKMLSRVGQNQCVTVAEHPTKQAALDDVERQMKGHWFRPSDVRLIQGRNVLYGMHHFAANREPFYFTFLRHPVDRFVSQYSFYEILSDNPEHPRHSMAVQRIGRGQDKLSLEHFVEQGQGINMMTRAIASAWLSPEEEPTWWHAPKDQCLDPAIKMLDQMSFIGLVENFRHDASQLCQLLGIRFEEERLNQSRPMDISDSLKAKIEKLVADDLEIYQYAKARSGRVLTLGG